MTAEIGHNDGRAELTRLAKAIVAKTAEIAELQGEVKDLKAEAKAKGFNVKALGTVIRELAKPADYMAQQLTFELERDLYREAVGLPTNLEVAQRRVADAAGTIPEAAP